MITTNKKTLFSLGILLIINVLFIISAVLIFSRINNQKKVINDQLGTLNKRNLSTEDLRENLSRMKIASDRISSFSSLLFTPGDELTLITDLENLAIKNSLTSKISSSNLDNYAESRLDIELMLSGPLKQAMNFINDLESYKYIITINKIEFTPTGQTTKDNTVQNTATLHLYISAYARSAK